MKIMVLVFVFFGNLLLLSAQQKDSVQPRPLTMAEYAKAKTYSVPNLDKDTYVKFDNAYILDRYEQRKPYFITGDDGLKKRIDLYKLIAKEGLQELGTIIYYTNEKGKVYTALQPNFTANGKVWEQYFEDVHLIDKEEKNFVLKLSYILSREMSFHLYKAINKGKDLREESATYGSDICFPGDQRVTLANGNSKLLASIRPGDQVLTLDPVSKKTIRATVNKLVTHNARNYAITKLLLVAATEKSSSTGMQVHLSARRLAATPNHPVWVGGVKKKMADVVIGDEIEGTGNGLNNSVKYMVLNAYETANGLQKVYNMQVTRGSTFVVNGVMVMQK